VALSERDLDVALGSVLGSAPAAGTARLQDAAAVLTNAYRSGRPPGEVLGTPLAARAYAAYRMPATFAAVRAALRATDLAPETLLDLGGGTGAAVWAAAAVFPSLREAHVVDGSTDALALGRAVAERAPAAVVRAATWTHGRWPVPLPAADLVTMSYFLGELPAPDAALAAAIGSAPAVAVIEPGTPAGFRTVLAARDALVGAGWTIAAPCPHDGTCPWAGDGPDWCHFAARVPRSVRHRQVKGGTLGWEDEKFGYVVATRDPAAKARGRIVRHPYRRKGLVELTVCQADPGVRPVTVSKRQGADYRAARDAGWGDRWPPRP
jgi:ribosomal protein RSM22 (predicted rRNA methylase)